MTTALKFYTNGTLSLKQVQEVYSAVQYHRISDVARHYGVTRPVVDKIKRHEYGYFEEVEIPSIEAKIQSKDLAEDAYILAGRGMTVLEIAEHFGVDRCTVDRAFRNGPPL